MKSNLLIFLIVLFICACSQKEKVDLLVYNATVYTVDSSFSIAEAIAVKDGKIVETGKTFDLQKKYSAKENLNAQGNFIYPGFIDAHAHFFGYGYNLNRVDLVGTES
jgi:predicted amidohydrolase YtcJ